MSLRTDKGIPRYDGGDRFVLSAGEELVPKYDPLETKGETEWVPDQRREVDPVNGGGFRVVAYRPRVESNFARTEHWIAEDGSGSFWQVRDRDDRLSVYGRSAETRIADPADPRRIFRWLIESSVDAHGNEVRYVYKQENDQGLPAEVGDHGRDCRANRYPERILYGAYPTHGGGEQRFAFEVIFDYGEYEGTKLEPVRPWPARPDPFSTYRAGFEIRTYRLCRRILMVHHFDGPPTLVSATRFAFDPSPFHSQLTTVEHVGYKRRESGDYASEALPALELEYGRFDPAVRPFRPLEVELGGDIPGRIGRDGYQMVDLYGDGLPGILHHHGATLLYWRPAGNGDFEPPRPLPEAPSEMRLETPGYSLMDVGGDGHLDLVVGLPDRGGYYPNNADGTWEPYRPFPRYANQLAEPAAERLDVDGDGRVDLLVMSGGQARYSLSRGAEGFEAPATTRLATDPPGVPVPPTTDGGEAILLGFADVFGDGLAHRVRVRDGLVEVWPNLGYGRFGERVVLGGAPRLRPELKTSRLFLADVDGSGTADLIVVYADHFELYRNRSGNGFAPPTFHPLPGPLDDLGQVSFADIDGTGTSDLVVSRVDEGEVRPYYLDLSGGARPFLLRGFTNRAGEQTRITYQSSTADELADRRGGHPWVTRLPFPVQVVSRVETVDLATGRRRVRHNHYGDGYFDAVERELRGFFHLRSEVHETFAEPPPGEAGAPPWLVQPSQTRSWSHVGAFTASAELRRRLEQERFAGDPHSLDLPPSAFGPEILASDAETLRQAHRALAHRAIRREVYGLGTDGHPEDTPFRIEQSNYTITLVQPRIDGHFAVFQVVGRESATSCYERQAQDPRIEHGFELEHDAYGNVLRSAHVAYPRRTPEVPAQRHLSATAKLAEHINLVSETGRRLGVPFDERRYELSGLLPRERYFSFAELDHQVREALDGAIPYGQPFTPGPGIRQARLFDWRQSFFWQVEHGQPTQVAPLGQLTPQALLHHRRRAVFSNGLIRRVFADVESIDDILRQRAGYVPDLGYWWNPGSAAYYQGRNRHFVLRAVEDPFRETTAIEFDPYDLRVVRTTDPLGQSVNAVLDYRVLRPSTVVDVNGIHREARYDALGRMLVSSTHKGDTGNQPLADYRRRPRPSLEELMQRPEDYLQGASRYYFYQPTLEIDPGAGLVLPAHAVTLRRVDWYFDDRGEPTGEGPIDIAVEYADGAGRPLLTKTRVEAAATVPPDGGATDPDRVWIAAGRVVPDSAGRAVRQYLDHITGSYLFEASSEAPYFVDFYDAMERAVRRDTPKGFFTRMEHRAWSEVRWDQDDTVTASPFYRHHIHDTDPAFADELDALKKAAVFDDTPTTHDFDPLGRTVREHQIYVFKPPHGPPTAQLERQDLYTTYLLDIQGQILELADPRFYDEAHPERPHHLNFVNVYDMSGTALAVHSADAGPAHRPLAEATPRRQLHDATGHVVESWTPRGFHVRTTYDALRRILSRRVARDGLVGLSESRETERYTYGRDAEQNNRNQVVELRDQAGLTRTPTFDLRGEPTRTRKQILEAYDEEVDWSSHPALMPEVWTATQRRDALGRLIEEGNFDGSLYRPTHYANGWLKNAGVELPLTGAEALPSWLARLLRRLFGPGWPGTGWLGRAWLGIGGPGNGGLGTGETGTVEILESARYDAQGQRLELVHGNGAISSYTYDEKNRRLRSLLTRRAIDEPTFQDLRYTYDPVGNVTRIRDLAQPVVFHTNRAVKPENDYTYDSLYQLKVATGRQQPGIGEGRDPRGAGAPGPPPRAPRSRNDGQSLEPYTRTYNYELSGNLVETRHRASTGWSRETAISETSNHGVPEELLTGGAKPDDFYDADGNLERLEHLPDIDHDYRGRISSVTVVDRPEAVDDRDFHLYDSTGRRVRKVERRSTHGGAVIRVVDTLYLGNVVVTRTTIEGGGGLRVREEVSSLRLRAGGHLALVIDRRGRDRTVRYQLEDRLGSVTVELDQSARVITFEEYFPFGGSSIRWGRSKTEVETKRYRYSGKELDRSTGLYDYGERYYAPWLGRWLTPDPAGTVNGPNLFAFVKNNPMTSRDGTGEARVIAGTENTAGAVAAGQGFFDSFSHFGMPTGVDAAAGGPAALGGLIRVGMVPIDAYRIHQDHSAFAAHYAADPGARPLVGYSADRATRQYFGTAFRGITGAAGATLFVLAVPAGISLATPIGAGVGGVALLGGGAAYLWTEHRREEAHAALGAALQGASQHPAGLRALESTFGGPNLADAISYTSSYHNTALSPEAVEHERQRLWANQFRDYSRPGPQLQSARAMQEHAVFFGRINQGEQPTAPTSGRSPGLLESLGEGISRLVDRITS
ncbi:MAG: FG-GAP-like repeat-containing protein [Holophagales bacterium]|nr:FG-GAP-like repeat-containing protein [Holophagales bacterium]